MFTRQFRSHSKVRRAKSHSSARAQNSRSQAVSSSSIVKLPKVPSKRIKASSALSG